MMDWTEWEPYYSWIVDELDLNPDDDQRATTILSSLLEERSHERLLNRLHSTIKGREVIVCGAGPSLGAQIDELREHQDLEQCCIVAADGAVSALVERDMKCDLLVTDLDGAYDDIIKTSMSGTLSIVHGHGDNIPLIQRYIPELEEVLGSTQVKPLQNVFLWGGFTDGDRACYIVSHYSPKQILLVGMDFGGVVGRWSKPDHTHHFEASSRKASKLRIAKRLIDVLSQKVDIIYLK